MRHRRTSVKLGRTTSAREALLASLVNGLIRHRRIKTTLAKARLARSLAERMVTLAKEGTLHARRQAIAALHHPGVVARLFDEVAPTFKDRRGGYTRIVKIGTRDGDGAELAYLEWIHYVPPAPRRPKKGEEASAERAEPKKAESREAAGATSS